MSRSHGREAGKVQFGVELEFNVLPAPLPRPIPAGVLSPSLLDNVKAYHTFAALSETLRHLGFRAAVCLDRVEESLLFTGSDVIGLHPTPSNSFQDKRMIYMPAGDVDLHDPEACKSTRFWVVGSEVFIGGEAGSVFQRWVSTELRTPILPESEARRGFRKLNRAMEEIHYMTMGHIHINSRCGMHVHVSPANGMSLRSVRRLATLMLLIEEPLLFRICATHRRMKNGTVEQAIVHFARRTGAASCGERRRRVLRDPDFLEDIPESLAGLSMKNVSVPWCCRSHSDFGALFTRMHQPGVLQCALAFREHEEAGPEQYSLEFRHAQGSMYKAFVDNWVLVVLAVCKVCLLQPDKFRGVLESIGRELQVHGPTGSVEILLRTLHGAVLENFGLQLDTHFWLRRLASSIETRTGGMDVDDRGEAYIG